MSFKIPLTVGKLITKFLSSHAEHQMSIKLTIQVTRIYGRIYKYEHKKEFSHILNIHTSGYQDNFWVRITPFGYKYRYMPTRVKNKGQNNRTNVISSCCIKLIYAISYSFFILPSFSPFLSHNSSRKKRINIVRKKSRSRVQHLEKNNWNNCFITCVNSMKIWRVYVYIYFLVYN